MMIDSADDSKISNLTINTSRISNRTYDSKWNRIMKLSQVPSFTSDQKWWRGVEKCEEAAEMRWNVSVCVFAETRHTWTTSVQASVSPECHCLTGLFGEEIGPHNPLCSVSSTGCGSWSGSGSGHAFWCTAASTAPRRHISPTTFVELPTSTVAAVYALPSQTCWSWHQRTVQHSTTVLSQWLYQERGMACLPQSQPLRHCRRFVRNWRRFSSGRVFSDLSRPVAYHFWHCIQHVCCVLIDIVNCLCNVTVIMCISNNNNKL